MFLLAMETPPPLTPLFSAHANLFQWHLQAENLMASLHEDDLFYTHTPGKLLQWHSQAEKPMAPAHEDAGRNAFNVSGGGDPSTSRRNSQSAKRSRDEMEQPPLLRLEVLSGPASGQDITVDDPQLQVSH